jgi:hypothetical protein
MDEDRDLAMGENLDSLAAEDDRGNTVAACAAMTIRSQPFDPAVSMIACTRGLAKPYTAPMFCPGNSHPLRPCRPPSAQGVEEMRRRHHVLRGRLTHDRGLNNGFDRRLAAFKHPIFVPGCDA